MQWRIQELTEGECERGVWGACPPGNAVADPGVDGRGAKGESGGLPPGIFRVSNDY